MESDSVRVGPLAAAPAVILDFAASDMAGSSMAHFVTPASCRSCAFSTPALEFNRLDAFVTATFSSALFWQYFHLCCPLLKNVPPHSPSLHPLPHPHPLAGRLWTETDCSASTIRYNNDPKGAHMPDYTAEHARAGINAKLPALETWPNQFESYVITTRFPEYTSVCPKTGMPDNGALTIQYMPRKQCLELKALKLYLLCYRNLGILYENAVNKILHDIVEAAQPVWCVVRGEFTPRGGLTTTVFARWPELKGKNPSSKRSRR